LEKIDLKVDVYNDPLLVLSDYKSGTYDLLLLDIRMPKVNGFELYQKIKDKEHEYGGNTSTASIKSRVCFITAYEEYNSDFKKSFPTLEEADCFLRKPISLDDLVKVVK
jgi:CheY-like chemotaxis protein